MRRNIFPQSSTSTPGFSPSPPTPKDKITKHQCQLVSPTGTAFRFQSTHCYLSLFLLSLLLLLLLLLQPIPAPLSAPEEAPSLKAEPLIPAIHAIETKLQALRSLPLHVLTTLTQAVTHDVQAIERYLREQTQAVVLPKIYVYDLPKEFNSEPFSNIQSNPHSRKYYRYQSAEKYIHQRLLKDAFIRVTDPSQADLFLVPIYISTLLSGNSHDLKVREATRLMLLKSVQWIQQRFHHWNRLQGLDHVFIFTHDQGSCMDIRKERNGETPLARKVAHVLRNAIHLTTMGWHHRLVLCPSVMLSFHPWWMPRCIPNSKVVRLPVKRTTRILCPLSMYTRPCKEVQ